MPVVKQLNINPITTTIYIEFDMIVDVDFGLLRYVGANFADDRIFYTELFDNEDTVIKGLLMERESYNPLAVPAIDETDIALLNSLYDQFMEKYKYDIVQYSDITALIEWIVKLLHSNSGIQVSILCRDEIEKSTINDIMEQCQTSNYDIIMTNNDTVDVRGADVIVTKFSKNLYNYDYLEGKTIYLADIVCNADIEILENNNTKYPNIDAVLFCESNEFKFITMYPYDNSYSINGEFNITTNDPSYYEDDERYVFDDDDEVTYGDVKLLEQWLSPDELEQAKLKNHVNSDDDNNDIKVVQYNPLENK